MAGPHDDDAPREHAPEQSQSLAGADGAEATTETVATPETDGARIAEAGHGYVGRQMDDRLKSSPRERDGDAAVDHTAADASDETA